METHYPRTRAASSTQGSRLGSGPWGPASAPRRRKPTLRPEHMNLSECNLAAKANHCFSSFSVLFLRVCTSSCHACVVRLCPGQPWSTMSCTLVNHVMCRQLMDKSCMHTQLPRLCGPRQAALRAIVQLAAAACQGAQANGHQPALNCDATMCVCRRQSHAKLALLPRAAEMMP